MIKNPTHFDWPVQIIGLDSCKSAHRNDVNRMLTGHLRTLRRSLRYGKAYIYCFIESNYGGQYNSTNIEAVVTQREFRPIEASSFDEKDEERVGVWVDDDVKESMAADLQRSLADGQLCFADEFITTRTEKTMTGQPVIQQELIQQLTDYREELMKPHDAATGKFKKVLTGKSSNKVDDLCICLQICLRFGWLKRKDANFIEIARRQGWTI